MNKIDEIKHQIKKANFGKAVKLAEKLFANTDFEDTFTTIAQEYADIENDEISGVMGFDVEKQRKAQITQRLLKLLNKYKDVKRQSKTLVSGRPQCTFKTFD